MAGLRDHLRRGSHISADMRVCRFLSATLIMLMLAACGASAQPTRSTTMTSTAAAAPVASAAPCAAAAGATRAAAAGFVARRIYGREVSSPEVSRDRRQVEGYAPLLRALAGGSRGAVQAAVTSLVFSHTHVVRLRISKGGSLLADVGGPYILAPVGGSLRVGGRTVGRYLLSVQDDSGYAKLATRYIGYPLLMRQGARRLPVEGTFSPGSTFIPARGPVSWRGSRYDVFSLAAQAYPSGPLEISMLVPPPSSSAASCTATRVAELNRIAQRIWRRFQLVGAPVSGFVSTMGSLLGALSYVRAGSHQLSGSTSPGPARLPAQGTVTYHGVAYLVFSFPASTPGGPVRAYELVRAR
ncbi:MAG TPA: hypothetical protein VGH78_00750 [Solirubrobacteraceae bacterium]